MEIKVTCAWCKKHLTYTEWATLDKRLPPETHSICEACNELLANESNAVSNNLNKNNQS